MYWDKTLANLLPLQWAQGGLVVTYEQALGYLASISLK
jgi:hypothetical protein